MKIQRWERSLAQITGKKIVDVVGVIREEWGDPLFILDRIVFEDGTFYEVEGEHDCPYALTENLALEYYMVDPLPEQLT